MTYYPAEDRNAATKRFRAGEIDIQYDFASEQIDWLEENLPEETRIAPWLGIYYYAFNTRKPPFDNKAVRQALALAIDREAITDKVLRTGELPGYSFVPPGTGSYGEPSYVELEGHALRGARRQGQGADGRGGLSARTIRSHDAALQHLGEPQEDRGRGRRDVEAARRRDRALQHRGQGPLQRPAGGQLRGRARRLDRRLQRPAELPLPDGDRERRAELRRLLQPGVRPADGRVRPHDRREAAQRADARGRGDRDGGPAEPPDLLLRVQGPGLAGRPGLGRQHQGHPPHALALASSADAGRSGGGRAPPAARPSPRWAPTSPAAS